MVLVLVSGHKHQHIWTEEDCEGVFTLAEECNEKSATFYFDGTDCVKTEVGKCLRGRNKFHHEEQCQKLQEHCAQLGEEEDDKTK
ncbi:hypothetical protein DPMN_103749 [Dreissena polymorpha]|uniref:Uncharacterized protein n=1 Tax=Dreissena polymorpha TaxID=45954 RepID=A0A9D4HAB7_DREPO|nr:hypothetical protein DPMN_103749 [Dreissena polymorpha]